MPKTIHDDSPRSYPSEVRIPALTKNERTPSIVIPIEFIGRVTGRKIDAKALIDSGAEGIFINTCFATENDFTLQKIPQPFPIRNVDGSGNALGWVREQTIQQTRIYAPDNDSHHTETTEFYITDIGDNDVILGMDWLKKHNPEIDWAEQTIDLSRCPHDCEVTETPVEGVESIETARRRG